MQFGVMYSDYDGVCCDFRKGVYDAIGHDIEHPNWNLMEQGPRNILYSKACDNVAFWSQMKPMRDYVDYWSYIKFWNPAILTAYPMWKVEAQEPAKVGKALWNKKFTMVPDDRFHVVARIEKQKYAINKDGLPNILIDDSIKNINEWRAAGGVAILHYTARETIKQLKALGLKK